MANAQTEIVEIDVSLVRKLIAAQFSHWANLPIKPVEFSGWDNRTFHLGDHMTVRLPSAAAYAAQVEKEHRWLPELSSSLPLPIPVPLAMGRPSDDYPWHWSVYKWIEGENATIGRIADLKQFAITLAEFLNALQRINATDGPPAGQHNFFRGGSLGVYDKETRQTIATLGNRIDAAAAAAVWQLALDAAWHGSPVWVHGDISAGNLLIKDGRLNAVIDFGCSAVGDPACDLAIAWTFLESKSRAAFRETLHTDSATWARGRGWALWKALITFVKYPDGAVPEAQKQRAIINEVLRDKV